MDLSGTQGELPIPMQYAASPYGSGATAGGHVVQLNHGNSNNEHESPALPSPPAAAEEGISGKKRPAAATGAGNGGPVVKYRECLKNHAATMGGHATDGCGEFMPSGEEGSLEALKCYACGCHRNFHRKEGDGADINADGGGYGHRAGRRLIAPAMPHHSGGSGGLLVTADPYGGAYSAMRAMPPGHPVHHQLVNAMPLSAMRTSESDEMDAAARESGSSSKKRFRTKFTAEQKVRMLEFAERVGWHLPKLEDAMVQAFCQEIGVKRRVLKVWMHNNKHNLAAKGLGTPPMPAMASPPPPTQPLQMPMSMVPPPPLSSQPGPSFHLGGPSSPPPPQMPMPMVPPLPQPPQMPMPMVPSPPPSPQPGPSFHLGGPSSPPSPQMPLPMVPPSPPSSQPGPSFRLGGPSSPPPLKMD